MIAGFLFGFNILLLLTTPGNHNTLSDFYSNLKQVRFYIVSSGSMEPAISVGSAILTIPQKYYSPKDVVSFKLNGDKKTVVTHRIASLADGAYQTKGDANKTPDAWKVNKGDILGKVAISLPYLGYLINFVKLPYGFILLIIIPATIIIYEELRSIKKELVKVFKNLFARKKVSLETENSAPFFKILSILPIIGATFIFVAMSGSFFFDSEKSINNILTAAASFPQVSPSPSPSPSPQPEPEFPNCPREPGADVEGKHWDVGYSQGVHWIVNVGLKWGADYVYYLGPVGERRAKVLQCYYPNPLDEEDGIQTNWLKIVGSNTTNWETWPDGSDFGLDPAPYAVKNIDFQTP